jgi:hypothetical protein
VNVNVFWTTRATEELTRIRRALARDGNLFLFYEMSSTARAGQVAGRVADALRANRFAEPQPLSRSATLIGSVSRPA